MEGGKEEGREGRRKEWIEKHGDKYVNSLTLINILGFHYCCIFFFACSFFTVFCL